MADFKIASPPDVIFTTGVGSCVVVCLYGAAAKLGGLAHIMLPWNKESDKPGKYADTAIAGLIELMGKNGAPASGLTAKITGGASVLATGQNPTITVGKDNISAVTGILARLRVPVIGQDTGGASGRSVSFFTETGLVEVTRLADGEKIGL
jgi:chemotaxis protein CheD